MYTTRHGFSPATARFNHLFLTLMIALLCVGAGFPGAARAEDNISIFWDADFTRDATTVNTFPGIVTGYLVLKDPSISYGVTGWELCASVEGPAQLIGWTLEGNAINVGTPPCFAVGIGPVPLRSDRDVLLATFQVMVNGPAPVALSVGLATQPSVPDQMSYVAYGGDLIAMTTLSGQPEVAWINDEIPHFTVDPTALFFNDSPVGIETVQTLTVSNFSGVPGDLDITLATNGCDVFSLPGISGPVTIPSGGSIEIPVACNPLTEDSFSCTLILGGGANDVQMTGNGRIYTIAWDAPTEVDFGPVAAGLSSTLPVVIINTGDFEFSIDPVISAACSEFDIVSGGSPSTLQPGELRTIHVFFHPTVLGTFSCSLDLGNVVPAVDLVGSGRDPLLNGTITPAALDFGAIGVGSGLDLAVTINNTGEGAFEVAPVLPDSCSAFSITDGAVPFILHPGNTHTVTIQFSPLEEGVDYLCSLDLGYILADLPLSGSGLVAIVDWTAPTAHDFGPVGVGLSELWSLTVTNIGNTGFQVDPGIVDNTQGFWLETGVATFLNPGQSIYLLVRYNPLAEGLHSGVLDLGSTVTAVQLQGEGTPRPAAWFISPNLLDFGTVLIGSSPSKTVTINNTGGTILDLDISLVRLDLGFTITSGTGIHQLGVDGVHEIEVLYQPDVEGFVETNMNLGPEIGTMRVKGSAIASSSICTIQPESLVFGPIRVGDSQFKTFTVTNNGIQPLIVSPVSDSSAFISSGGAYRLDPGQTAYYSVRFEPPGPGTFSGTISLGDEFCNDLTMTGTATIETQPGQNLVGIFFDNDASLIEAQTFGPNEIVEGYLFLLEPSETSGVGAWELSVDIDGDAQWLNWTLEGTHINVGTYNDFIVGIGVEPLPYSSAVKLATFQILVANPYPSIVYLELGPTQRPSIPDQMVWAPWHDASMLMPMYPFTGQRVVAGINWGSPVGVENPAPRATLNGGEVALQWPIPDNPGDGCHVYRRDKTGAPVRLTNQPVSGFGASLNFTDHPAGYAAGSILYYSYSVVIDGAEGPRSPETEIKLTGIPQVATRLLPNVPNPFNPLTEIRFELSRPQQARVAIYDVTGRLVKILADGHLEAGPHTRVWQGRDSGGRKVPSGAYYVRLVADGRIDHHKMMLLK